MAIIQQALEKLEHFALAPTASRNAALDGTAVDLRPYDGDVILILDVAAGGTSTCTVTLQDSADNVTFANVTAEFTRGGVLQPSGTVSFAQVSTSASKQTVILSKDGLRRYVKAVSVEAGTHVYSVNGIGVHKYG
jgi:hypothetical protein